jgi:cold shock CspA family protein
MKGIVATWLENKGYGFVQSNGSEIFLHISNVIEGIPQLGAEIEFEIGLPVSLGKKPQAVHAKVISVPDRKDLVGGSR